MAVAGITTTSAVIPAVAEAGFAVAVSGDWNHAEAGFVDQPRRPDLKLDDSYKICFVYGMIDDS